VATNNTNAEISVFPNYKAAKTFIPWIHTVKESQPWSNRSPNVDALPIFLACLPSKLSKC